MSVFDKNCITIIKRLVREFFNQFEDMFYTEDAKVIYPYSAFSENTNIQIPMILREEGLME